MNASTVAEIVETVAVCCWLLFPLVLVILSDLPQNDRPRRSRGSVNH